MKISLTRTRDFGAGGVISVTLESEGSSNGGDALIIFDKYADLADKMLAHYTATKNNNMDTNPMIGQGGLVDVRMFPATEICVTMKDGKKLHKVKGGEYSEHGIPFYAEYMKMNGYNPAEIPDDGVKLTNMQMMVEFKGNAPKRVIKLEKVDSG